MKFQNTYHGGNPYNRAKRSDFESPEEGFQLWVTIIIAIVFATMVAWMILQ